MRGEENPGLSVFPSQPKLGQTTATTGTDGDVRPVGAVRTGALSNEKMVS